MSKKICNAIIILFIMVCFTATILSVVYKSDWKAVIIPLVLSCAVILMFQAVIYKGKKEKLISQIPWEYLPGILSKGHKVTIGTAETTIQPGQKQNI